MKLWQLIGCLIATFSFSCGTSSDSGKRETIKIYSAKTEFDKVVKDTPLGFGYFARDGYGLINGSFGIDYSCQMTYDKLGRILKKTFIEPEGHDWRTSSVTEYEYIDNQSNVVKLETTIYSDGRDNKKNVKEHIYDNNMLLIKLLTYSEKDTTEKRVYSYDSQGRRISKKVFSKEGLKERIKFEFLSSDTLPNFMHLEVFDKFWKDNLNNTYSQKFYISYNQDGKESYQRVVDIDENGREIHEMKVYRMNYNGDIPTKIIFQSTPYNLKEVSSDDNRRIVYPELDRSPSNYDTDSIIQQIDEKGNLISRESFGMGMFGKKIEADYTYNDEGEWVKMVLFDAQPQNALGYEDLSRKPLYIVERSFSK